MKITPRNLLVPTDPKLFRTTLLLAMPVIFGNLSRVAMNVVGAAMVGVLGPDALAAVGIAAVSVFTAVSFGLAVRTAVQAIAARRLGEKVLTECGNALNNGLLLGATVGILVAAIGYAITPALMEWLSDDPRVIPLAIDYAELTFLSVLPMMLSFAFQGFFNGIERTKVHLEVMATANVLNVYLNAGLIYGSDSFPAILADTPIGDLSFLSFLWAPIGFPEMGVRGAALATLIASSWMVLHYFYFCFFRLDRSRFGLSRIHLDRAMLLKLARLAAPQGVQELIVMLAFVAFFKIAAMIGTLQVAATEIAFTIMQASFMPAMGFGVACATLVGKSLGERNPDRAEASILEALRGSLIIMGGMGLLFIFFPAPIAGFFTDDPGVIALAASALTLLGIAQFADAFGMTLWFALSGAGDTRFPAMVEMAIVWGFFIPACYLTAVVMEAGILGAWISFALYIFLYAAILLWKIRRGDWKRIRV